MQTTLVVILANENHWITRWLGPSPTQVEIAAALYGATRVGHEAESAMLVTGTKTKQYSDSHIRWMVTNLIGPASLDGCENPHSYGGESTCFG
jgi:hypothetical protein